MILLNFLAQVRTHDDRHGSVVTRADVARCSTCMPVFILIAGTEPYPPSSCVGEPGRYRICLPKCPAHSQQDHRCMLRILRAAARQVAECR
jgi:hypothetical protein